MARPYACFGRRRPSRVLNRDALIWRGLKGCPSITFYCLSIFCLSVFALGSERTISQYVHTSWGAKEGAPSGALAMAQTKDGYLWLAGNLGLYRFDGVSFERYESRTGAAYSLLPLPDGSLWIGSYNLITHLENGKSTEYTSRDGVPDANVMRLAQDWSGAIWAATKNGLVRFEDNRWKEVGQDWNLPGGPIKTIYVDREGTLWVATEQTILYLPSGAKAFRPACAGIEEVWQFAEAPNGKLWMAETSRSVRPVPLGRGGQPSDNAEIKVGSAGILFDREGALWITTVGDGLRRAPAPEQLGGEKIGEFSDRIESFTTKDGLSDDQVIPILEDREGNIWVATNSGLDRFRQGNLVPLNLQVRSLDTVLAAGDAGDLWISSRPDIFHVVRNGKPEIAVREKQPGVPILSSYRDPAGIIWWIAEGQQTSSFPQLPPRQAKVILPRAAYVTEDRSGVLWAAGDQEGLLRREKDKWTRLENHPEFEKRDPAAALTDWTGRLWFEFNGAGPIVTVNGGTVQRVFSRDDVAVGALHAMKAGNRHIWVAGSTRVAYSEGNRFYSLVPADGQGFRRVSGIEETSDGSLWLCEIRGVVHIPSAEVVKFLANPSYRVQHYEVFDSADGLQGTFENTGTHTTILQGTDGRLWFEASKGIFWLDPTKILRNLLPPPVSIQSVRADGRQYGSSTSLVLPPRSRNLHISYTALSLSIPERVHFRYKLEGVDKNWEDAGTRREAFYTTLGPGHYRFHVIACNNDGVWNEEGATLDFKVAPAWNQTVWFLGLSALSSVVVIWGLYRLRVRQIHKSLSARFDERLAERTRMARELHDTFLQTIQGSKLVADNALKKSEDPERMRRAVEQLSVWLGQATEEGRAALNSLRTSTTQKNDLAEAFNRATEESRLLGPIEVSFSVAGDAKEMHPVVRDEIYRIGYEAIRNACAHSKGSRLEVRLKYGHDLALHVKDNGVGIDPTIVDHGKEGHFGLQGMRERVARIGGKLTVASSAGSGTEITVVVPGGIVFREPSASPVEKIRTIVRRLGLNKG